MGIDRMKNRMEEVAKPHRQLLRSYKALAIGGPIKVVTRVGVLEKAKARVRFFSDDVSATIMFKT